MSSPLTFRQWSTCRMVFHPHDAYPPGYRTGALLTVVSPDVVGCNTSKSIGQAAGGFSASLVAKQRYLDLIRANDWVEIFIDAATPSKVPVMIASIDRVRRKRSTDTKGATKTVISITGRDYGKVFLNTQLIIDPQLGSFIDQTFFNQDVLVNTFSGNKTTDKGGSGPGKTPLRPPHEVIEQLLYRYHDHRVQCTLPPSLKERIATYKGLTGDSTFASVGDGASFHTDVDSGGDLALRLGPTRGRQTLDDNPNLGGNLWSTMEQYSNQVLNEMWVDTEGGIPTLHLEERPFSSSEFSALNGVPLFETEVVDEDLGKGDEDIRNWLRVYPDGSFIPAEIVNTNGIGRGNVYSMARAGIRKYEPITNAFGEFDRVIASYRDGIPGGLLEEWAIVVGEWYAANDELLSGTFVTRLRPDARVGRRLDYTNTRTKELLSFYIESVSHTFQYPGASTTTLEVTRGTKRDQKGLFFPDLKKAADAMDNLKGLNLKVLGDFVTDTTATSGVA